MNLDIPSNDKYKDGKPSAVLSICLFTGVDMNDAKGIFLTTDSDPVKAKIIPVKAMYESTVRYAFIEKQLEMECKRLLSSAPEWGKFVPEPEEYRPDDNILMSKSELKDILIKWYSEGPDDIDIESLLSALKIK